MLNNKTKDIIIVLIAILLAITILTILAVELTWYWYDKNYFSFIDYRDDAIYDRVLVFLSEEPDEDDLDLANVKSIEQEGNTLTIFLKNEGKRQCWKMMLKIRDLDFVSDVGFYYE